jgi:hypothetical protein
VVSVPSEQIIFWINYMPFQFICTENNIHFIHHSHHQEFRTILYDFFSALHHNKIHKAGMAFIKNLPVSDGDDDSADHPYVKNLKRVKSQAEAKKLQSQRQNQTSSEVEGAIPLKPGSLTSLGMSQLNWPFEN